jgi:hypothetical protein
MNSLQNRVRVSQKIVLAALLISILPNHLSRVFAQSKMKCVGGLNYPWIAYGHDFGSNALGHDGLITSGWTYQTFQDSQGFTDTRVTHAMAHTGSGSLAVLANLAGHDPNRSKGEVYIDLRVHSRRVKAPLNLLGATISFWIFLPKGAAGPPSAPNGIQVFLKSGDRFFNWYSPFRNITLAEEGVWTQITVDTSQPPGFVDSQFDFTQVVAVGIKIAINDQSAATLAGTFYIDDFVITAIQSLGFDFERLEVEDDFASIGQTIGQCVAPVVRVFVFADGRASPEFGMDGSVTGLDNYFFQDFDALINAASQNNLLLVPVIVDFNWFNAASVSSGVQSGGHSDVIRNPVKRQSFIDNALKPLVQRYADSSEIFAWEIGNEPEWAMQEVDKQGFSVTDPVTVREMQDFVRMCVSAIHSISSQKVTLGSARRTWLQYWTNLGLDYYQFHFYDKFQQYNPPDVFPFATAGDLGLDKPCFVGEAPSAGTNYSAQQYLQAALDGGYAGLVFWSFRAMDSVSDFPSCMGALQQWCPGPPALISQVSTAKKLTVVSGTCFDQVAGVSINQIPVDSARVDVSAPDKIVLHGKRKVLGIVGGPNHIQLKLKSGSLSQIFEFDL